MPTFTAPLKGGAATLPGTVTFPGGITPATLGMAFDGAGVMRGGTEPEQPVQRYLATFVASNPIAIGGGTTSTGDLANIAVANPDLSITKTNECRVSIRADPSPTPLWLLTRRLLTP